MIDLSGLDEDQLAAATAPRGPVCILAGAGTGKTRTITYRIAHLVDEGLVNPSRVLAVTFTSRAAGEMRDRLAHMGVAGAQARTFHAAALRQLRYFWPQVAGDLPWRLIDNKFPFVARAARAAGLSASTDLLRDLLGEIEWAKASLIGADGYAQKIAGLDREPPADPAKVADVYRRYEELKNTPEGMLLDFDDLLVHTAGALENSAAVAEEFHEQYRTFVVDEYQDVTPLQQRVLDAWLGERDDLTVVGDANQTIYSFTGASPDNLLGFSRRFPHATAVKLQRDYRSTPQVTGLANTVIGRARGRAAGTRLELEGMRPDGPEPEYHQFPDEPAEARAVAGQILTLIDSGVAPSEIAVLYRVNSQSAVFEEALADAGVVYQVRGGEGFFRRPVVKEAMRAIVRAAKANPVADENLGAKVRAVLEPLGLTEKEPSGAQARERWQLLGALVDVVEDLERTIAGLDMRRLVRELSRRAEDKQPPKVEGVTLASLHAAKGLEWDAVFLVGLVENTLPISHAIKAGDEQIEEERRLFYVGVTRAREHLHLSWSLSRKEGGKGSRKRTRFLDGIAPQLEGDARRGRAQRPKRCRVCGRPLDTGSEKVIGRHEDCPAGEDAELFEALRSWRAETAREAGKPAFMVFSDATLTALAEAQPSSEEELLGVPGVGPVKVERYGDELLNLLSTYR